MSTADDLQRLKKSRALIKAKVTRFINYLNTEDINSFEIQERLNKYETVYDEYDQIQSEYELIDDSESDERETFESVYFSALAKAKAIIQNSKRAVIRDVDEVNENSDTINLQNNTISRVNLPTLNIPEFSGLHTEWLTFRDTFESLISNNESLTNIQKFHYLRSVLRGEALRAIASITLSNANYSIAWDTLKERYENKKLILHNHIKALFEIKPLRDESHVAIRKLIDAFKKNLHVLKSLDQKVEHWDAIIIHIITTKLDEKTRRDFENSTKPFEFPKLKELIDFLNNRCILLETLETKNKHSISEKSDNRIKTSAFVATRQIQCIFCNSNHSIYNCTEFLKLAIDKRLTEIKKLRACINCLRIGHTSQNCRAGSCKQCHKRHNTLLHFPCNTGNGQSSAISSDQQSQLTSSESSVLVSHCATSNKQTLLATAIVTLSNDKGHKIECRALLDSGSQSNFITKNLSNDLHLQGQNINVPVIGINSSIGTISHKVEAKLISNNTNFKANLSFLVINTITENLPNQSFEHKQLNIPNYIKLADPNFSQSNKVDILLGAEVFFNLLANGRITLNKYNLILQNTKLGWIVSGPLALPQTISFTRCNLSISNVELHKQIEKFWRIEQCTETSDNVNKNSFCERHFVENFTRNIDGRIVVKLPFRNPVCQLGDSEQLALKRFKSLENKLIKNPKLQSEYKKFIHEYIQLNHMSEIKPKEANCTIRNYLPHHGVIKETSTTTKLRVVFDASAKTSTGISLNDALTVGPTIQRDLVTILINFRIYKYALIADVEKMYRQVLVDDADRNWQCIFWRDNPNDEIKSFRLNTVTYGTAPAAFLATRALLQSALDVESIHPKIARIIKQDFYVDDLMTGADSEEELYEVKNGLSSALKAIGFSLRKWNSNNLNMVANKNENTKTIEISDDKNIKTLGIAWSPISDKFSFPVKFAHSKQTSKREILSSIAKLFDPLGLLGPIIVQAKIIMQRLWQIQIGWDDQVPSEIVNIWNEFCENLSHLHEIEIPRQIAMPNYKIIELHGFSDASERAYGACIYLRTLNSNIHSQLICSKSRVAPLKVISLPRLELCGAVLLIRLMQRVREALKESTVSTTTYWCDSTIVLSWIKGDPCAWKTFVANRVSEIQQNSDKDEWLYIPTNLNPADIISRGCIPQQLKICQLWWHGPSFLSDKRKNWPKTTINSNVNLRDSINAESRKIPKITLVSQQLEFDFNRFQSYTKTVRVWAYISRFINNLKNKNNKFSGQLSVREIIQAVKGIVKQIQAKTFTIEIHTLQANKDLPPKNSLLSLSPFLDSEGILRVGGRIVNSHMTYDMKHPMLLPSNHLFVEKLIRYEHIRNLHAGPQLTLTAIRSRFWIIKGKNSVKNVLRKCVTCFKIRPPSVNLKMGDLPGARVVPARPFSSVGIDFAGPLTMKDGRLRTSRLVKVYVCVFVCLISKAIHLEIAMDLSVSAFLNCLKRFVARRGLANNIYSDNATNFVGSKNELERLRYLINKETQTDSEFNNYLLDNCIEWHFIPPRSPSFGGLWEAAVKSAKNHLVRIVGGTRLNYDCLSTVLCQIESVLNSRPLTQLSSDPNDLHPLTPAHFLIGGSLMALPQEDLIQAADNRLSKYQQIQKLLQHFWKRWTNEYLTSLQQRTKWRFNKAPELTKGTLVIIREDNVPPLNWKMGRIVDLHPGKDGIVRVVTVKTSQGIYKRSVNKICILPID